MLGLGFVGLKRQDEPNTTVTRGGWGMMKPRKRERNGDTWDMRFAQLLKFREKYGHTDVPSRWQTTDAQRMIGRNKTESVELSTWVHNQRLLQHRGALFISRAEKLAEIGFNFRLRKR